MGPIEVKAIVVARISEVSDLPASSIERGRVCSDGRSDAPLSSRHTWRARKRLVLQELRPLDKTQPAKGWLSGTVVRSQTCATNINTAITGKAWNDQER